MSSFNKLIALAVGAVIAVIGLMFTLAIVTVMMEEPQEGVGRYA